MGRPAVLIATLPVPPHSISQVLIAETEHPTAAKPAIPEPPEEYVPLLAAPAVRPILVLSAATVFRRLEKPATSALPATVFVPRPAVQAAR